MWIVLAGIRGLTKSGSLLDQLADLPQSVLILIKARRTYRDPDKAVAGSTVADPRNDAYALIVKQAGAEFLGSQLGRLDRHEEVERGCSRQARETNLVHIAREVLSLDDDITDLRLCDF